MTREDQVLALLAGANPVSDPTTLAIDTETRARLETIEQWSANMEDIKLGSIQPSAQERKRRSSLVGTAAAVLVLAVGLGTWIVIAQTNDGDVSATQPPSTTTLPTVTANEALAASGEFVDAFNSGDSEAVLALLTADVALSENYTGGRDGGSFDEIDRAFFDQHLAWATAQGTTFTSPKCVVTDDSDGAEVTVSCEFGWLYAPEKAAGDPPVPTMLTMLVSVDGISGLAFEYPPTFGVASFDNWLILNHPDDSQGVEFGDWSSVAEAQQGGILRAQYVAEWAAELEANG